MKRHEHAAIPNRRIGSHIQFDRAPPTGNPDAITVVKLEPSKVIGIDGCEGFGFDRIERVGPAGHRSRVPVLQNASGVEHEGIGVVRQFVAAANGQGTNFPRPEAVGNPSPNRICVPSPFPDRDKATASPSPRGSRA